MKRMLAAVLAFAALPALPQDGSPERPLDGFWFVGPEDYFDEPKGKDSHLYLRIEGEAARALWDGLRESPERDECLGLDVKRTRTGIRCEHDTANGADLFSCVFAIDMKKARIGPVNEVC